MHRLIFFTTATNKQKQKENEDERLQKVIAHAGITSRRKAEELITEGRVRVNGQVIKELGVQVGSRYVVEVDGVPSNKNNMSIICSYKPRGVI